MSVISGFANWRLVLLLISTAACSPALSWLRLALSANQCVLVFCCLHLDRSKNVLCSLFSDLIEGENALGTSTLQGFPGDVDLGKSSLAENWRIINCRDFMLIQYIGQDARDLRRPALSQAWCVDYWNHWCEGDFRNPRGTVITLIIFRGNREGRDGSLSSASNPPNGTNPTWLTDF